MKEIKNKRLHIQCKTFTNVLSKTITCTLFFYTFNTFITWRKYTHTQKKKKNITPVIDQAVSTEATYITLVCVIRPYVWMERTPRFSFTST